MITRYTKNEIEIMKQGGAILNQILEELKNATKEGITSIELDNLARSKIKEQNVTPSFLHYRNFPAALCVSLNDEIVHGIPHNIVIKKGDLVSLDLGIKHNGLNVDKAISFVLNENEPQKEKFLNTVKLALNQAIKNAKVGHKMGAISNVIQKTIESGGFSVAKGLFGHGVGKKVHEDPMVPNFGEKDQGIPLTNGMVLAIEPMAMQGKGDIKILSDGFSIASCDGSLSCHFEETVAITDKGPIVLT